MATKPEVIAVLTMLEEICVRKEPLSDAGILAYVKMLEHIPSEVLQAAALQCAASDKWFPTPADLLASAASLVSENIPDGMTAWGEVQKQMSRVGHMGKPEFSHELIEQTVKSMGWRNLCLSESGNYDRHAFIQAYEQVVARKKHDAVQLPQVKALAESKKMQLGSGA